MKKSDNSRRPACETLAPGMCHMSYMCHMSNPAPHHRPNCPTTLRFCFFCLPFLGSNPSRGINQLLKIRTSVPVSLCVPLWLFPKQNSSSKAVPFRRPCSRFGNVSNLQPQQPHDACPCYNPLLPLQSSEVQKRKSLECDAWRYINCIIMLGNTYGAVPETQAPAFSRRSLKVRSCFPSAAHCA